MSGFEELKGTFFDEANEGLVALEAGLNEIREGTGSEDTVHAIFRAVHSIKGGAGVWGAVPMVLYGWWASLPGSHASPFDWSMTADAWSVWLSLTAARKTCSPSRTATRPPRCWRTKLMSAMVY